MYLVILLVLFFLFNGYIKVVIIVVGKGLFFLLKRWWVFFLSVKGNFIGGKNLRKCLKLGCFVLFLVIYYVLEYKGREINNIFID